MVRRLTFAALAMAAPLLLSCGSLEPLRTSLVTITVGSTASASLQVRPVTVWDRIQRSLSGLLNSGTAVAQTSVVPANVAQVRVTASAADMAAISTTVAVTSPSNITVTMEVQNGSNRTFLVEGLNAAGAAAYSGQASADLTGVPVNLTVILTAVTTPTGTAPSVIAVSPSPGASLVPISTAISALFSTQMNTATITTAAFTLKDGLGNPVAGTVLASGATATFTPSANLTNSTLYTAMITSAVKDLGGVALPADYTWTFTTSSDTTLPTFAGLHLASIYTISSTTLDWTAATDNVSPSSAITYLIYQATTPGGQVYTTPTYIAPAGSTSYTVTNLVPGTQYYFVVRARDEAGNIDANTVEQSFVYPGKYVSAATGTTLTPCGTQANPCRTIDLALTQTTGNEGLFVSAGTYTAFATLQLKPGTQLACTGAGYTSVIVNQLTGGSVLSGNQGALIDGCKITDPNTSFSPIITDNATDITVNNCIIQGNGTFSTTAISLSKKSTVTNVVVSGFVFNASPGNGVVVAGGNALISNSTFSANYNGVLVSGGTVTIIGSTFRNNSVGINSAGTATTAALISGNTITASSLNGISVSAGAPTITGNVITNSSTGIVVTGGTTTVAITGNTIRNNALAGISFPVGAGAPTASITGNSIDHNATGLAVQAGVVTATGNSLFCNSTEDVGVFVSTGINITNNSWDHASPSSQQVSAGPCTPAGIDVCAHSLVPIPSSTPVGPVVASPCPP